MAANVDWVLNEIETQPAKAFVWAHNAHVMYGDITERSGKLVGRSLGKHIRNNLNGKVYSIGLHFNKGSFIANEIKRDTIVKRVWKVDEVPGNRFLYLLSRTNMEALFMDFYCFQNKNVVSLISDNRIKG